MVANLIRGRPWLHSVSMASLSYIFQNILSCKFLVSVGHRRDSCEYLEERSKSAAILWLTCLFLICWFTFSAAVRPETAPPFSGHPFSWGNYSCLPPWQRSQLLRALIPPRSESTKTDMGFRPSSWTAAWMYGLQFVLGFPSSLNPFAHPNVCLSNPASERRQQLSIECITSFYNCIQI